MTFAWKKLASSLRPGASPAVRRRSQRMAFSWDGLEDRKVMSHMGGFSHMNEAAHQSLHVASTGSTSSTSSTSSTLTTARQALEAEVQTIKLASGTTVGDLTAIHTTSQTLKADGLTPTSQSALATFENGLVTAFAGGTTLAGDATLLASFEALYTTTPTTQETTDLTAAYDALAKAVTDSNITTAEITSINTLYSAVLAAEGNTSTTATYPYFNLVTGGGGPGGGFGGGGFGGGGHCM